MCMAMPLNERIVILIVLFLNRNCCWYSKEPSYQDTQNVYLDLLIRNNGSLMLTIFAIWINAVFLISYICCLDS